MFLIKPSYQILTEIDHPALLRRIEVAGRTCYKSEEKMTESSASGFIQRIIKSGHESVIEHESISVRFIVDRGVTHEMVRHLLAAFSQESTRYCDYAGRVTFIIPSWMELEPGEYFEYSDVEAPDYMWFDAMLRAEDTYKFLLSKKWSPQQARSVLPNSLKTEIVMTANLREWRHVLKLRTSKAAHPQMREIMCPLLDELKLILPEVFCDIHYN